MTISAGAAIFVRLKALGIDYVFCNAGTDFPPVIEGLAKLNPADIPFATPILVPHEHAALGMAHGYYQATGRMQAVFLHTNVGLANGVIGAINAACDHVPMLILSGRTPVTEHGRFGARTVPIGWGQEMRDQTALVRESVKWDYELKFSDQIADLLDRACAIARSTPRGPVYLSLPREILCEDIDASDLAGPPTIQPSQSAPPPSDVAKLALWIKQSRNPLIVAQRGSGSPEFGQAGFEALQRIASDFAIPVCHYWAVAPALPSDHPMNAGDDPGPLLQDADLILVIDCLAPWQPDIHQPSNDARIVHIGPDPVFARFPVRHFRSDLTVPGETLQTLLALEHALQSISDVDQQVLDNRRRRHSERNREQRNAVLRSAFEQKAPITKACVGTALSAAVKRSGLDPIIISELGCPLSSLNIQSFDGYRQEPHAGGLGFGITSALGAKLADRGRLVIATVGDGSYIFANPTACHQIAEAQELAVIILVLNNGEWGAVRQSVLGFYPDGAAATANQVPLTSLDPSPNFAMTASASRAFARNIENFEDLPKALDEAIEVATKQSRQVLLNIKIGN